MNAPVFSWLQPDWERINIDPARLHHGLLLTGNSGIGKREFACLLAQSIVCSNTGDQKPCGQCQDCRLFTAGTHPDFHVLTSEREAVEGRVSLLGEYAERYQDAAARDKKANPSMVINVDQIRHLIDRFYQASHISERRVALIFPADRMNVNAANALLKLLEEPPENAHLLLVTADATALPATIRSRVVVEVLTNPQPEIAQAWLLEKGADDVVASRAGRVGPLDQLAQSESGYIEQKNQNIKGVLAVLSGRTDAVELAALLSKQDNLEVLTWFQQFCADIIRWRSTGDTPGWHGTEHLPATMNIMRLYAVYDKISTYRRLAREQLNIQLALEEILISLRASV